LNRYFDALLIHAHPAVLRLDETFRSVEDIRIPIVYTGFVTPHPASDARIKLRQKLGMGAADILIVASLGGGRVGAPLLESAINAFKLLKLKNGCQLHVFTGPLMRPENFTRLCSYADNYIHVRRFTPDFLSYLSAADLSVSMAGYNTCMNILAAAVPALVWPFSQNREQRLRAERLAAAGGLKVLSETDLNPDRLAVIMEQTLSQRPRLSQPIDLNGAANTAQWLKDWMKVDRPKTEG
jgi:predicted glycosyltransferase